MPGRRAGLSISIALLGGLGFPLFIAIRVMHAGRSVKGFPFPGCREEDCRKLQPDAIDTRLEASEQRSKQRASLSRLSLCAHCPEQLF